MEINVSSNSDRIVEYQVFDMAIDGNLAKTKLDAYGIPCFLTNENVANLYPINVNPMFGVRLMIFEKDWDRVKEILEDQIESPLCCPFCRSKNIYSIYKKNTLSRIAELIGGLTIGLLVSSKRVYKCSLCEREFDLPENF